MTPAISVHSRHRSAVTGLVLDGTCYCTGTAIENTPRRDGGLPLQTDDVLLVNLYVSSDGV